MLPKIPQPTLEQISFPEFQIVSPPGCRDNSYHHLTFTEPIEGRSWRDILCSVRERNFTLPSAQEFAAFQIATGERKFESGLTRTAAIYFKDDQKTYVAFDDTPDPQKNILLKRMEEGMSAYALIQAWQVSKRDKDVRAFLTRAERDKRICDFSKPQYLPGPPNYTHSYEGHHDWIKPDERRWGEDTLVQAVLGDCAADFVPVAFVDGISGVLHTPFCHKLKDLDEESVAIYGVSFDNFCLIGIDANVFPHIIDIAAQSDHALGTRGIKKPKEWTKAL